MGTSIISLQESMIELSTSLRDHMFQTTSRIDQLNLKFRDLEIRVSKIEIDIAELREER